METGNKAVIVVQEPGLSSPGTTIYPNEMNAS